MNCVETGIKRPTAEVAFQSVNDSVKTDNWAKEAKTNKSKLAERAPSLGLQDYKQPFSLHVYEKDGFATRILIEKYGSRCHLLRNTRAHCHR